MARPVPCRDRHPIRKQTHACRKRAGDGYWGISYDLASDDGYLAKLGSPFEPGTVELFRTVANGSELSLDIGANIGCTAILLSQLSKQVHAFEPSPSTFKFLQRNVQASGAENIHLHNFGLGEEHGKYPLTFAPADRSGGFVSNMVHVSDDHATENVVIHKLDDVVKTLALKSFDFIKVDVEGFEGHVLRGATDTLARFQPVVAMELNHWCLNAFQRTSVPDFLDQLRAIFPVLYAVDGTNYLDIHDESDRYLVMYYNITMFRFMDILAAFREDQISGFSQSISADESRFKRDLSRVTWNHSQLTARNVGRALRLFCITTFCGERRRERTVRSTAQTARYVTWPQQALIGLRRANDARKREAGTPSVWERSERLNDKKRGRVHF